MGVYCINAARYMFQAEPTSICAFSANNGEKRFRRIDEMTSVLLRFPEERLAAFTCSFGAADASRFTLIGTKGSLTLEPAYDYSIGLKHHLMIGERVSTRTSATSFAAELIYFSDCVLRNKEPEPSGWEGWADVRIVRAIYQSAQTGRAVNLTDWPVKKKPTMRQEIHRPSHSKPKTVNAESPSGQ